MNGPELVHPGVRRGPGGMCDARAAARACVPSRVMLCAARVREGVIRWVGRFAPFFRGLLSWCRTYLDGPGRGGLAGPSPHQTGRWLVTPQALVTRRNHPARCPPPAQCYPLLYDLRRICPLACVRCVRCVSRLHACVVCASCVPLSVWWCGGGGGGRGAWYVPAYVTLGGVTGESPLRGVCGLRACAGCGPCTRVARPVVGVRNGHR